MIECCRSSIIAHGNLLSSQLLSPLAHTLSTLSHSLSLLFVCDSNCRFFEIGTYAHWDFSRFVLVVVVLVVVVLVVVVLITTHTHTREVYPFQYYYRIVNFMWGLGVMSFDGGVFSVGVEIGLLGSHSHIFRPFVVVSLPLALLTSLAFFTTGFIIFAIIVFICTFLAACSYFMCLSPSLSFSHLSPSFSSPLLPSSPPLFFSSSPPSLLSSYSSILHFSVILSSSHFYVLCICARNLHTCDLRSIMYACM